MTGLDVPPGPIVLLADADADVRAGYQRALGSTGCDFLEASDGVDALRKALERSPTLVITDLELPLLDGAVLCDLLRHANATRDVPVIVVAEQAPAPRLDRALEAGATAVLTRPLLADILRESQRLLRRGQTLRQETLLLSQQVTEQLRTAAELRARSEQQRLHLLNLARGSARRAGNRLLGLHRVIEDGFRSLLAQVLQSNACNALHAVPQRFARWLLTTQDCVAQDELQLSHEFLAQMLAVQRPTISEVAAALQDAGIIHYRRGRIRVVDREALQRKACECYAIVRAHRELVLRPLD